MKQLFILCLFLFFSSIGKAKKEAAASYFIGHVELYFNNGELNPVLDEDSICVPNVFTPNSDGQNDLFIIEVEEIKELSITIYNRWGQEVLIQFRTGLEDSNISSLSVWDGRTSSGREVSQGTYYYVIDYLSLNNSVKKKTGTITLLR